MTDEPFSHPSDPDSGPADDESGAPEPNVAADPLDERLSAELDGEADTTSAADDDPRAADRRRALTDARDLLAIAPPPLDDITRRRLMRVAVAERPRRASRDLRRFNQIGAVAAVLAVVFVGGFGLRALVSTSNGGSDAKTSAQGGASGTTMADAAPNAARDLRDVSDPQVLRERVASLLGGNEFATTTSAVPERASGGEKPSVADDSSATKCLSAITVPAGATAPEMLGNATYKRTPAVVVVAFKGRQTLVYVLAKHDCRLLTSQFFGR